MSGSFSSTSNISTVNRDPEHIKKIERQYLVLIENFRSANETLIKNAASHFNELVTSTQADFRHMNELYARGNRSLLDKAIRANKELIEVAQQNTSHLRENVQKNFKRFRDVSSGNYEKRLTSYMDSMRAMIRRHPELPVSHFEDMMSELSSRYDLAFVEFNLKHAEQLDELDRVMREMIEGLPLRVGHLFPKPKTELKITEEHPVSASPSTNVTSTPERVKSGSVEKKGKKNSK